jgi:hypothetical protein
MFPENVVVKLRKQQTNHCFYSELSKLCETVEAACTDPALRALADAVLVPAQSGRAADGRLTREQLAGICGEALARISALVDLEGGAADGGDLEAGGEHGFPGASSPAGPAAPCSRSLARFVSFR